MQLDHLSLQTLSLKGLQHAYMMSDASASMLLTQTTDRCACAQIIDIQTF